MLGSSHRIIDSTLARRSNCPRSMGHHWVFGKAVPGQPSVLYEADSVICARCGIPQDGSPAEPPPSKSSRSGSTRRRASQGR